MNKRNFHKIVSQPLRTEYQELNHFRILASYQWFQREVQNYQEDMLKL